jgi:hypothetical protein
MKRVTITVSNEVLASVITALAPLDVDFSVKTVETAQASKPSPVVEEPTAVSEVAPPKRTLQRKDASGRTVADVIIDKLMNAGRKVTLQELGITLRSMGFAPNTVHGTVSALKAKNLVLREDIYVIPRRDKINEYRGTAMIKAGDANVEPAAPTNQ